MAIDLSGYTREELLALKKQVDARINWKSVLKSDTIAVVNGYERLRNALSPSLRRKGVSLSEDMGGICNTAYSATDLTPALFKLCDITLGNYRVATTKARADHKVPSTSGSYLIIDDSEQYSNMLSDLISVIEKYAMNKEE